MSKTEVWAKHLSVHRWNDASMWDDYFRVVESTLSDRLIKLDVNDPIRRKADAVRGEGEFAVQFKKNEDSRTLFGVFEKTGIHFQLRFYKLNTDSFGRLRENSITFYIPEPMSFGPNVHQVVDLFRLSNERLKAFYAAADLKDVICAKRPSTPSLDISRELLGVFWLTFFGSKYCDFFGCEKLAALKSAVDGPNKGITLQLGETPSQVSGVDRSILESVLGPQSFAGTPGPKAPGQYALSLAQLSASE